jgi:hypothetical protein
MTEQQRQILAQAKKKLQLELVRDGLGLSQENRERAKRSEDAKQEISLVIEDWEDDREAANDQSLRDKREVRTFPCV